MVAGYCTGRLARCLPPVFYSVLLGILFNMASARAAETVESLRYGASLYHFYQNDYFEALTELMVGQAQGSLASHSEGAELLRGGMSLSYGMDLQAESIFDSQLNLAPEHIDRSRAWFFLGKVAWQRGERLRALEALGQMEEGYEGELAEEANYLQATALLSAGEDAEALARLYALPKDSKWRYYLHYNTAVSLAKDEQWAAASEHFQRFDELPLDSDEEIALYERAQTAAGYTYLAADQPAAARAAFEGVRLEGAAAQKALLGFGWAAVREGDYLAALSAWKPLTSRSMLSASARESLLAVPYAYEALGRPAVALDQYELASALYEEQLGSLKQAIAAFETEPVGLLLGLAESAAEPESQMSWVYADDILPDSEYAVYLQFLVTRHSFQVALRELRDLYDMRRRLLGAQERLAVLHEVDKHQQAVWTDVLSRESGQGLAERAQALRVEHGALLALAESAIASQDGRALADPSRQAQWRRLDRALANARALERHEQYQRLLFLQGILLWDDSEAFPQRQWELRKSLAELEGIQRALDKAEQQLASAITTRGVDSFRPRIESLDAGVAAHLQEVDTVLVHAEKKIRQLAVAALQEQAEQLRRGLGQSGLAIARLYDAAARRGAAP